MRELRALARTPWYAATVVGVVALGLVLASTVFAIVDGVLFKPLPYPRADELFVISGVNGGYAASVRDVQQWARAVPEAAFGTFQHVFELGAIGEDHPHRVRAAGVDQAFFSVARVNPLLGGFTPDDFEPSAGQVAALISYSLWQSEFGGRADVVGTRLNVVGPVNQVGLSLPALRVAGVLPEDFIFPNTRAAPDIVLPIALTPEHSTDRNWSVASALVRVPRGLTAQVLSTRVSAIAATQAFPRADRNFAAGVHAEALGDWLRVQQIASFRVAFVLAAAIVLLACVNIAGLAVARRRTRSHELALHIALGAGRLNLIGLTFREVLPLAGGGWLLAVAMSPVVLRAILRWMPSDVALLKTPAIDWRVLGFAALAASFAILTTCAAELRGVPDRELTLNIGRGYGVTPRRGNFAVVVIAAQVAIASVLAVSGTLVVGSLWLAWQQDPGYSSDRTVVLDFSPGDGSAADRIARVDSFIDACRRLQGVERVGAIGAPFLRASSLAPAIRPPSGASRVDVQGIPITEDIFAILGLTPIEGRLPTRQELATNADVVVVSERIANAYWPGRFAVGQTLDGSAGTTKTVIGVVRDARYGSLDSSTYGQVYSSYRPFPYSALLIRTATMSDTLRAVLRRAHEVGGGFGVDRATTMEQALSESIGLRIFRGWLFGGFTIAAMAISAVGILGVIAMTTSRRTRELGVRLTLGATRAKLIRLIMIEQILPIVFGLCTGGLVARWTTRFVQSYLYQFTAHDPRLWTIAALAIVATAIIGGIIPAIRASRVDPIHALREE